MKIEVDSKARTAVMRTAEGDEIRVSSGRGMSRLYALMERLGDMFSGGEPSSPAPVPAGARASKAPAPAAKPQAVRTPAPRVERKVSRGVAAAPKGRSRARFAATPELVTRVRQIALAHPEWTVGRIYKNIGVMSDQWVRNILMGTAWTKDTMTPVSPYYASDACLTRSDFLQWREQYVTAAAARAMDATTAPPASALRAADAPAAEIAA